MSKKTLQVDQLTNELHGASVFFKRAPQAAEVQSPPIEQSVVPSTRETTPKVTRPRDNLRKSPRQIPREHSRPLPTRDEIQEFSFRLRDEFKVKVQAEVPPHWQEELDEVARTLKVRKLELYRFILGEFLGKVKRKA